MLIVFGKVEWYDIINDFEFLEIMENVGFKGKVY